MIEGKLHLCKPFSCNKYWQLSKILFFYFRFIILHYKKKKKCSTESCHCQIFQFIYWKFSLKKEKRKTFFHLNNKFFKIQLIFFLFSWNKGTFQLFSKLNTRYTIMYKFIVIEARQTSANVIITKKAQRYFTRL